MINSITLLALSSIWSSFWWLNGRKMKGGVFGCVLYLIGENVKLAVASSEGGGVQRELSQTPTWAVAAVCTFFIAVSVFLEKVLHKLGTVLWERHKKALLEALEKVKSELMIVGFISLLLTFGQSYILRICIPASAGVTMLPCPVEKLKDHKTEDNHRKLLWLNHRILAGGETSSRKCGDGYEPLISSNGLHQLHILIFFLAVFHVIYSFVTMMLGRLKIRGWKQWEQETQSHDYEFSNDPSRFRLTHETSFVRAHTRFWTRLPFFFYVGCFFRQFSRSVGKVDYLTLRNGFISVHLAPGSKFNFQKYIKRSLEDDFKVVVGVSPVLWTSFVVFLLLNVDGWKTLLWASLLPVIIILLVGTKLQAILTNMALEISERHSVVQGMPLVQGSDKYFWFGHPQLLLHLIHFALFQNAFQITYVFWIWYSFGLKSCFHADLGLAIVKVSIGVGVLCLCSYITLPLYALVTQMGSRMKKSIFDEQTSRALKKWRMTVKKKLRKPGKLPTMRLGDRSTSPTASSTIHSSGPSLHRYKTTGHSTRSSAYNDLDASDLEAEFSSPSPSSHNLFIRVDDPDNQETEILKPRREGETSSEDEFSFANSAPGVVQP